VSDSFGDWSEEDLVTWYTMGSCHVLALAVASRTGMPLGIMWNGMDWHVEPDENGEGGCREVVHVYVDCGDGTVLDARGRRTLEDMKVAFAPYEHEVCPCEPIDEEGILRLVEDVGCLRPYDAADVEEAGRTVERLPALAEALRALEGDRVPAP
jgi:hypothetical protein